MKKLTKKQRREIYLKVVTYYLIKKNYYAGFSQRGLCYLVNMQRGAGGYSRVEDFPELELFEPDNYEGLSKFLGRWWVEDDTDSRINCMLLCAEMTKS